jgi:spermidine synthase
VVLIGLGAAALAAYAKTGEHWTFFEINPEVVAIANRHFTYLADARTRAKVDVEVGDGRLLLKDLPEHSVDILVLDAFSSDAVPMHLLTKDALAVYRRALKPDGLILANVSNLVLRLQLVLGALAREAGIGALERIDTRVSPELRAKGKDGSEWVLISENPDVKREGWTPIVTPPSQAVWTDDFVNVFGVLR